MEEQKSTDKRKAPDKNISADSSDESLVKQNQVKRPRMEISSDLEGGGILDPFNLPREGDILSEVILETKNMIEDTTDSLLKEPVPLSILESGFPPIDLEQDQDQISTENGEKMMYQAEIMLHAKIEDEANVPNTIQKEEKNHSNVIEEMKQEDNNNEEKEFQLPSPPVNRANLQPIITSSPISDIDSQETRKILTGPIEIQIRAYDSKTKTLIFEDVNLKSDYERLESFLKQHNVNLTQSSLSSGYSADVSSQENSQPNNPTSNKSSYRNRNRWTSSTLGSTIPRQSTATVLTISPQGSPNETEHAEQKSEHKSKNRRGPKLTSTMIKKTSLSLLSSEGILDKAITTNGDDHDTSSNGHAQSSSSSSKSKSFIKKSSTSLETTTSEGTTPSKIKSVKTPKSKPAVRTGTPRPVSREFSGVSIDSLSSTPVEPSPMRITAQVEGTVAKPMTKFEAEVNNEPVNLNSLSKSTTLWGNIGPNELVYARWRDKKYYSGIVKQKGMNDTWIIDFDDGMQDVASETHIVPIKFLGVGTTGVYSPDAGYKPYVATVLGQKFVEDDEVGSTVKYAIQLQGEDKPIWCTRRQLSIEETNAKALRQEYMPTPKNLKAAEVSLENILSGPRRRGTPTQPKIVGGAFDESSVTDSSGSGKSKSTPKSKGLSVKREKRKISESSEMSDISKTSVANEPTFVSTPGPSSKTPEKADKIVKESPKKNKGKVTSLFEGFQFFLTASGGVDPGTASGGSTVPYDKDEYRDLIENHGGKIVDQVGKEGKPKENIFLISDNFARTVKYIYCLAASIPCVSHRWIQKCLDDGIIVAWKKYELSSGISLEDGKVIPAHNQKPLKGCKIFITAGTDDLYNYWRPVLTAAQATLLKPSKKNKGSDIPSPTEVLVTDATCSPNILSQAHEGMIPVVKPEWLVQTIILGKKVDYFGHEKYRVEVLQGEDDEEEEEDDDEENDENEEQS